MSSDVIIEKKSSNYYCNYNVKLKLLNLLEPKNYLSILFGFVYLSKCVQNGGAGSLEPSRVFIDL